MADGSTSRAEGEARIRVLDLHCDTLDRLALSGDPSVPGGFYEHDEGVPRDRMSSLRDNDAHVSLARTAAFDWCQCFAVFIPDELRGAAAWRLYERVRDWWQAALRQEPDMLSQARCSADIDSAFSSGKTAGILTDRRDDPTGDDVPRQVGHVLNVMGEHVVALGSDYDGCDVPSWFDPCGRLRRIALALSPLGEARLRGAGAIRWSPVEAAGTFA